MIRRPGRDDAEAFHEAWESGAPSSGEVAQLVHAAEAMCRAAVVQPRPEFRSALREQLMAEAATVLVATAAPAAAPTRIVTPAVRPHRARRRIAGIAVAAVSSAGVVGLVAGSASAVPGDVLYPVKRGVENVELAMHRSDEARGTYRLEIASERLREARAVIADGSPAERAQLPALLSDFTENAEAGSQELFAVYDADGSDSAVESVNDFSATAAFDLTWISSNGPADATAALTDAAKVVADLVGQAKQLCPSCETVDVGTLTNALGAAGGSSDDAAAGSDDTKPASSSSTSTKSDSSAPQVEPSVSVPAAPRPTATSQPPAPSASPKPSGLNGVTDPLLGGLLGDDEQEGLVPGLLNGLLGGKK